MKRSIIGLALLSGISACLTEGALPELPAPSASEALPSSLQIRVSDPDRPFDEAWEVTGQTQWVELEVEVRGAVPGQTESLLADETINFTFENARAATTRAVGLDQGSSCVSDDQGRCRLAVRVGTEPGDWVVRATALRQPDVYAEQHLIVGLGDRRRITLEAPGLPSRSWNGSLPHPWQRDEIILAQSEPDGGDLTLVVHDQYDNPVADLGVTLSVRALGAPRSDDAGPGMDAGAESLDAAVVDATGSDASDAPDAGARDAGRVDGGGSTGRDGCVFAACLGQGATASVEGVTDVEGRLSVRIQPGASAGRFILELRFATPEADAPLPAVSLSGKTYQRLAAEVRAEGEAICFPADTVRGARVRVLDALGYGVPNVPLQVIAEGLFAASAAPTDDTGATQVTARCPSQPPGVNEALTLRVVLVDQPELQVDLAVGFDTAAPDRITYLPTRVGETQIAAGSVSPLRLRVTDRNDFPVPGALIRAQPLSPSDLGRLTFRDGDRFVATQDLETDAAGEVIVQVRPVGARTQPEYPVQLRVAAAQFDEVRTEIPIHVLGGTPQRVQVVRGQDMQLLTGQGGALVTVRVDDGQDNPIGNVQVGIESPAAVLLAPSQGFTNTRGEFSAGILEVRGFEDDQVVTLPVSARWVDSEGVEWTGAAEVRLRLGVGSAQGVAFEHRGEPLGLCEGLLCLQASVGQLLGEPLTVRVVNANGGALAQQPVAFNLVDDQPQGCGSRPDDGADLGATDEQGDLMIGGDLGATWRLGDRARDCVWEVVSGGVSQRLIVRQQPGLPSQGTFQLYDRDGALLGVPSADLALAVRPLHFRRPLVFDADNAHRLRLVVVDRFGNPLAGERLLADPANCHVDTPELRLGGDGAADFWVTTGALANQPCVLSLISLRGWEGDPPRAQFDSGGGVIDVRDFTWDASANSQTRVVVFPATGDWDGFETGFFRGGLDQGISLPLSESTPEGQCTNRAVCTQAELLYLGTYAGLLPSPRVLCGAGQDCPRLLLTKVGSSVSVQVPREQLRRAGRFGLRLVTPGQPEVVSAVLPFWTRLIPLGRQRRVRVTLPEPFRWDISHRYSSSSAQSVHAQRFDSGRVRVDACGMASAGERERTAWVASATSEAPSEQRMTASPERAQAFSIDVGGYPESSVVSVRLCVPDDVNGDGVQDLILLGRPAGNLHGRNCLHMVVGDEQTGFVRQAQDLAGYCGTMPECTVRQAGEGEGAIAVIDWCDPDFPVRRRAYSLVADGASSDLSRYLELNFSSLNFSEAHGNNRYGDVWSIRRLGRLGQGGRFVVNAGSGSARLRHGVLAWGRHDLDGLAWDEVIDFDNTTRNNCGIGNGAARCSLIAQGGAEISSGSGYGRPHLYAGNGRVAVTSQGSLHTFDLITGRGLSWDAIDEQRGTSMNLDGTWYLRQYLGNGRSSKLRLERFGAVETAYPWADCNDETLAGCPAHELSSTFWLSDDVFAVHLGGQRPHTLRLYHKDNPLQAYSNSVAANSLGGYGIVWSTQQREAVIRQNGRLALVRIDLEAERDQRLQVEALPEAIRDDNGRNRCGLDPQGRFIACHAYHGPTLQIWDRQLDRVVDAALPRRVLAGEGTISGVQFLASGALLVSLHRNIDSGPQYRTTILLDPATGQLLSESHALENHTGVGDQNQARTAWQPPPYSGFYAPQSYGALAVEGDWVWNGYRNSYRLDLSGRQADELTRHAMPGVYRQKIAFDGDHHESLLLNTIDGWIIWTPQRAAPRCGDGVLDDGERCDDGNLRHDDDCPIDCRSVCGDGDRTELEACDDGNRDDGDGCSADCELP